MADTSPLLPHVGDSCCPVLARTQPTLRVSGRHLASRRGKPPKPLTAQLRRDAEIKRWVVAGMPDLETWKQIERK